MNTNPPSAAGGEPSQACGGSGPSQAGASLPAADPLSLNDLALWLRFECGMQGDAERQVYEILLAELGAGHLKHEGQVGPLPTPLPADIADRPLDLDVLASWAESSVTGIRLRQRFPEFARLFVDDQDEVAA